MIIQDYTNKKEITIDLPSLDATWEIYNSTAHKCQIKDRKKSNLKFN